MGPPELVASQRLASICEMSPDVRFGQMMEMMGVLAGNMSDGNLWNIGDDDLLRAIEKHLDDLERRRDRQSNREGAQHSAAIEHRTS